MLVLPAELTLQQATACLAMLLQGLSARTQPEVLVDASALVRFDTSALAVLLACRRECLAAGKTFVVRHLSPKLLQLAGLYGVEELLTGMP
jgi:phospholipid transport system transporter-binding protein